MKIVVVGGHFSPALSVIERLGSKDEVYYLGRKTTFEGDRATSFEYHEITSRGITFFPITTGRLQRKLTKFTLLSLTKFPVGFIQSYKILKKVKPDLVLSFGGYISIPVSFAAKSLNIPIVIHEQTLGAGLANKFIAKFAEKILISWQSSRNFFPQHKTILTGNPLTKEIIDSRNKSQKKSVPTLYISGGSAGSHFINSLVENNLKKLLQNFSIIHQTGDSRKYKDFERILEKKNLLYENFKKRYRLKKFLNPKETAYAINSADIVVSRAGINTISELIYLNKPAILIPLPFGQRKEQENNALFLKDLGLAELLDQFTLSDELFIEKVYSVRKNLDRYKLKREVLIENSSERIVKILNDISEKKTT